MNSMFRLEYGLTKQDHILVLVGLILYIVDAEKCCWSDSARLAKQSRYVATSHACFAKYSQSEYQVLCLTGLFCLMTCVCSYTMQDQNELVDYEFLIFSKGCEFQ